MLINRPNLGFGRGRKVSTQSLPGWVSSLPIWEWYSIPNTALSSVAPSPTPPGMTGPSAKISGWCGAALRRNGSHYIIGAAGGHADYYGNEVDALQLNAEVPVWVQLRAPSATADVLDRAVAYLDERRSASHNYWSSQYDNLLDRFVIAGTTVPFDGGAPAVPEGWPYVSSAGVIMAFGWSGADWLAPDALPWLPFSSTAADLTCSNPLTGDIYVVKSQQGSMYKLASGGSSWQNVGSWYLNGGYAASAVDPTRNRILVVGDFSATRAPEVRSTATAASVSVTFGGLGSDALKMTGYPGIVYDEANDTFLVFKNTDPISFYRVDAASFFVDAPSTTGTAPAQRPNGILNSVQYVPELKGVVIANSYSGNVKFMRTHE